MNNESDSNARIFAGLRILAILMAIVLPATATSAAERPNIVMLLADDLGYKDIGCDGGPVKTPALDGLAANGVRFTDFYSGAAVCSPSRATLLTGRLHIRTGVYGVMVFGDSRMHLLEREVTMAEVLKDQGYATAHFGKWHVGMPEQQHPDKPSPSEQGFDYWFGMHSGASPNHRNPTNFLRNGEPVGPMEGYSCQLVVDDAISWLDGRRDSDAPFFLNFWFHEPHDVIAAPDEIVSQYGDLDDKAAIYSGTIDNTNRAIARLLEKLKEVDAPEDTLIIYSSDNGSYRADRVGDLRRTKGSNYEGGIRVPGIFYWPGTITKGHVEREPGGLVDILPTLCGLLEIDTPAGVHIDGANLAPLLTGRADAFTRSQPLTWHNPATNPSLAIRDGKYSMLGYRNFELPKDDAAIALVIKQIEKVLTDATTPGFSGTITASELWRGHRKNPEAELLRRDFMRLSMFQESMIPTIKAGGYGPFELYDLDKDPGQQNDLSAQLPEVAARLKAKLLEINTSVLADGPDWD